MTNSETTAKRLQYYRTVLVLGTLTLVGVTWRLWVPQTHFPQVPLLRLFDHSPVWLEVAALAAWVTGMLVSLFPRLPRFVATTANWLALVALLVLSAIDQHRLQPWAYFWALSLIACSLPPPDRALRWARWLMISVYFFSGVSKVDYAFAHGLGAQFAEVLFTLLGVEWDRLPATVRVGIALALPCGEILAAVLLCFRATRPYGCLCACCMHLMLLLVLGPWGLQHHLGVLVWNVLFALQVVLLFGKLSSVEHEARSHPIEPSQTPVATDSGFWRRAILTAAMLLPLLEPWGWWDTWLSWGLYSARTTRVELFLTAHQRAQLSPALQRFCRDDSRDGTWYHFAIDRWSLDTLSVPIYPQDRFQAGVCLKLANDLGEQPQVMARHLSAPNRLSGVTESRQFIGVAAFEELARSFRLNAVPRQP